MQAIFIKQFKKKFELSFYDVLNIADMGVGTNNGIYHYVHLTSKDVYSFDTKNELWLEKNLFKRDILKII